jgi:membrane protein YdbS with pleckstrin-like domain
MRQQIDPVPMPRLPRTRHQTKSCPFCAETIRYEAIKCRFCGEFLDGRQQSEAGKSKTEDSRASVPARQELSCEDARPAHSPKPTTQPPAPQQDSPADEDGTPVLWSGRPSLLALAGMFLKTGCFLALCWVVYRYPVTTTMVGYFPKANVRVEQLTQIEGWLDAGALALSLLAALTLAWKVIVLKSIGYEVTPDRIEWSRGVFDRHVDNIDMFRVVDLKLRQSLFECLLGIGTVILITTDETDPEFDFVKVNRCRNLYDALKEAGLNADKKRNVIHVE